MKKVKKVPKGRKSTLVTMVLILVGNIIYTMIVLYIKPIEVGSFEHFQYECWSNISLSALLPMFIFAIDYDDSH